MGSWERPSALRRSLAALLLAVLAACGGGDDSPPAGRNASSPIWVTDWTKTEVSLSQPAERVACLFGACVDALSELGMVPVLLPDDASKAGLSEYFGNRSADVPRVGGSFFEPNLEDVAAAKPDLVIGGACFHEGLREALKPIAPLLVLDIGPYKQGIENLRTVARLTGRTAQADDAVERLERKIRTYADQSPRTVVPLSVYPTDAAPLIDSTDSQVGSLLGQVGQYPWPAFSGEFDCFGGGQITYSMEKILEVNPDVLFVVRSAGSAEKVEDDLARSPVWGELKAVKSRRVHELNSFPWSVGGTRSARLALDTTMTLMYPETFPKPLD